ncbi:N-acetylmuramidase family protein [bacterium]|nr:N-acetylmuramidase family protein [bacterium]
MLKEKSRTLTLKDKEDKAKEIGVELAALRAVIQVESSGGGFLNDGRPKILFEGHIFWRQLALRKIDPAPLSEKYPDIIYPKWVKTFYKGGVGEFERLDRARTINDEAALASASWGAFQIMGFNYAPAGFGSVNKFVDAHYISENDHLTAFCNLIKNQGILPFLISKNWEKFAERYNGSGQIAVYAGLLKKAYEDFSKS